MRFQFYKLTVYIVYLSSLNTSQTNLLLFNIGISEFLFVYFVFYLYICTDTPTKLKLGRTHLCFVGVINLTGV